MDTFTRMKKGQFVLFSTSMKTVFPGLNLASSELKAFLKNVLKKKSVIILELGSEALKNY